MRKGVYPYENMDDWEKLNEASLSETENFYSHLNMGDVADADYTHGKRVCEDFEIKNLGDSWFVSQKWYIIISRCIWQLSIYVSGNGTLLLADVFGNFRYMCLEIDKLEPARFLTAPGLECQTALKKTKVKVDLLTDIDMLLMVEKGIRSGICHAIHQYAKVNNKYMK